MTYDERDKLAEVTARLDSVAGRLGEVVERMQGMSEQVLEMDDRIDDLENERLAIKELPLRVAELKGEVKVLMRLINSKLDGVQESVDKGASVKTAIQFAAVVLVPIIVALIGGYVALKAGVGSAK